MDSLARSVARVRSRVRARASDDERVVTLWRFLTTQKRPDILDDDDEARDDAVRGVCSLSMMID